MQTEESSSISWWKNAVIYQIYPRSFKDSNNDGIGDLQGILGQVDYLASLSIDAIWISPFFKSPMKDFGYDVSDYRDVDPMFGNMSDFKSLLKTCHQKGIKIIIDMVLNHSSDQHLWFQESRQSKKNPKADWYVWADAQPDGSPPNNWLSVFGGSAWTWDPRRAQYYLHNFLIEQPDLNVRNPEVQEALLAECKFWLDLGVDGFRLDVCNFYMHDAQLRNNPPSEKQIRFIEGVPSNNPYNMQSHAFDICQEENYQFLKTLRELTDKYQDRVLIAEIFNDGGRDLIKNYIEPLGPLHTAYSFSFLVNDFPLDKIIESLKNLSSGTSPFWAFGNHDVPRVSSRFAPALQGPEFSKQLIAFLATINVGFFLYQGDELGLPEADVPFDSLQDPYGKNFYPIFKGRDGCRTPFPWDSTPNAGFNRGHVPWLPIPGEHKIRALSLQLDDPASVLLSVKRMLHDRRAIRTLKQGLLEVLDCQNGLVSFRRSGEEIIDGHFNFSPQDILVDTILQPIDSFSQHYEIKTSQILLKPYGAIVGRSLI
jgi:alpha-glucosidase